MKKLISILVAFAMMATLAVTMAFADDPDPAEGTIAVTKNLQVSKDIDIDDVTGSVTIKIDFDSATGSAATTTPENIGFEKEIDFATDTHYDDETGETTNVYSYTTGTISPADLGLNNNSKPGVYTYTVSEDGYAVAVTGNENEIKTTGSETSKTFTLKVLKDNEGNYQFVAEGPDGKVEIKNGTTEGDIKGNGLQFTNNLYDERESEPGEYEDAAFGVSKTVTDTAGVYDNEAFEFTLSVALPAGATADDVEAYFEDADGALTPAVLGTDYTIDGEDFTVSLADGEKFYFTKLPAGSAVKADETDPLASDVATDGTMYVKTGAAVDTNVASTGTAQANITNESQLDNTFEGVLHNSIPYIVLALVAIGGMAAYVIVRRRNADEA